MVLDLLTDVIPAVVDRPGDRTRLEQACVCLGPVGILFGVWIAASNSVPAGLAVAIPGATLWTYGSSTR